MKRYLSNRWFKIGFWLVILGWGPLLSVVVLSAVHLWPDPNPNPIGFGLLFFVTSWPAVICLAVGAIQVQRNGSQPRVESSRSQSAGDASPRAFLDAALEWAQLPAARVVTGILGAWLAWRGAITVRHEQNHHRGAAAMILYGAILIYWAITTKIPDWVKRRR